MKKFIGSAVLGGFMLAGVIVPAFSFAARPSYGSNPGQLQATYVGAQCDSGAGSGAFNALGKDHNEAGGTDGYQTGLNNSAVCGHRQ